MSQHWIVNFARNFRDSDWKSQRFLKPSNVKLDDDDHSTNRYTVSARVENSTVSRSSRENYTVSGARPPASLFLLERASSI